MAATHAHRITALENNVSGLRTDVSALTVAITRLAASLETTAPSKAAPAAPAPAAPAAPTPAPPSTAASLVGVRTPYSTEPRGVTIFVDIAFRRGPMPTPLEDYYLPLLKEIAAEYKVENIRCAPGDNILAFGRWKGVLEMVVQAQPPRPGIYSAYSSNEVEMVVVDALSHVAQVAQGMR